jgi:two-component system OmpR family response regulator
MVPTAHAARRESPSGRRSYVRRPREVARPEPADRPAPGGLFFPSTGAAAGRVLVCAPADADGARLAQLLTQNGFEARLLEIAESDRRAVAALDQGSADLIVVDTGPVRGTQLAVLQQFVRLDIPMIVVGRDAGDLDRVAGLELGADDYLGADIHPLEFLARVRAVLRRAGRRRGAWTLSADSGLVRSPGGATVRLPATSLSILKVLAERPRQLVSRETLCALTYGGRNIRPRSIDVRIRRLRAELRRIGGEELICTSYRQGWALDADMVVQ